MSDKSKNTDWVVYLIRNRHNALYCGITNDLPRRFEQHQSGKGAKALKGKGPLSLVWHHTTESKSAALKMEYSIKQQPKAKKEKLVRSQLSIELIDGTVVYS
ncbi:GIY-YIG nuclease family protein [Vibrio sp. T187]|uniref:GIY-YIG nuclease family protein n=1 Tax=Vibrio TaxID=662 RepID=UPI0010C999C2|nr:MULTISPECIES: GIY-YIG nuclease family protein [Vibrio]MBW3695970.1 GIY-YIG nuclease family protein [Vibrio sp. T187]